MQRLDHDTGSREAEIESSERCGSCGTIMRRRDFLNLRQAWASLLLQFQFYFFNEAILNHSTCLHEERNENTH
jgi:uncharacterized paraquat-inducible protein A